MIREGSKRQEHVECAQGDVASARTTPGLFGVGCSLYGVHGTLALQTAFVLVIGLIILPTFVCSIKQLRCRADLQICARPNMLVLQLELVRDCTTFASINETDHGSHVVTVC